MAARRTRIDTEGKPWALYLRLSKQEAAEDAGKSKEERLTLTLKKLDGHREELAPTSGTAGLGPTQRL